MSAKDIFGRISEVLSAERVYGEPCTVGDTTVIPAAVVRGGGGGGGGGEAEQSGEGGGFGVIARPVGAFVIDESGVRWKPIVDLSRIILGWQVVAVVWLWLRWRTDRAWAAVALAED